MADVKQRHMDQAREAFRAGYEALGPPGGLLSLMPIAQAIADAEERERCEMYPTINLLEARLAEERAHADRLAEAIDDFARPYRAGAAADLRGALDAHRQRRETEQ